MTKILIDAGTVQQALEALAKIAVSMPYPVGRSAIAALRTAIEAAEKQEPVAWANINKHGDITHTNNKRMPWSKTPLYTAPPAAKQEPLIDSVRQMRDVQGIDGTWNCDPYMHGLYNGLEFAVSLLEQREPQFRDAPEKWLSDLPKPRIFSATEAAHGIGEKK